MRSQIISSELVAERFAPVLSPGQDTPLRVTDDELYYRPVTGDWSDEIELLYG